MREFYNQTLELFRKHRRTEPCPLVTLRCCAITTCVTLLTLYSIFLVIFLAQDHPVDNSVILPANTIPVADLKLSWNYQFSFTCEYVYLDGTRGGGDLCNQFIIPPNCCDPQYYSDKLYKGYFTAWNDTHDLKYDLNQQFYGIWYTIYLNDANYNPSKDQGMVVRAYDSEFNPQTLSPSKNETAKNLDYPFYESLEDLNHHVIGYQQNNWMFVNRYIKKKLRSQATGIIGIPSKHFDEPYLMSTYESVSPAQNLTQTQNSASQPYANLFVGTLNWFEEEITENRPRSLLDMLALLAGFYAFLAGIYICYFGKAPIFPWGFCQTYFLRKQMREQLKEQYPAGIPLIEQPRPEATCKERLTNLERFMKAYIIDVDYIEDYEGSTDDVENEKDTVVDASGTEFNNTSSSLFGAGARRRQPGQPGQNNNEHEVKGFTEQIQQQAQQEQRSSNPFDDQYRSNTDYSLEAAVTGVAAGYAAGNSRNKQTGGNSYGAEGIYNSTSATDASLVAASSIERETEEVVTKETDIEIEKDVTTIEQTFDEAGNPETIITETETETDIVVKETDVVETDVVETDVVKTDTVGSRKKKYSFF